MLFGCMGLVPKYPGGELGEYSGAIAFSGIVAVTIVVSILLIYIFVIFCLLMIIFDLLQIIGHISNCHINPCVTLCALILGKLPILTAVVYFIAEFFGAVIGYGVLVVRIKFNNIGNQKYD